MIITSTSQAPQHTSSGIIRKRIYVATLLSGVISALAGAALLTLKADFFGAGALTLASISIALPVSLCIIGSLTILAAAILLKLNSRPKQSNNDENPQKTTQTIPKPISAAETKKLSSVESIHSNELPIPQDQVSEEIEIQLVNDENPQQTTQAIAIPVSVAETKKLSDVESVHSNELPAPQDQVPEEIEVQSAQEAVPLKIQHPKEQYIASYQLNLQPENPNAALSFQLLDDKWRAEHAADYDLTQDGSEDWKHYCKGRVKGLEYTSATENDYIEIKILLPKNCQKLDFMCYADRIVIYTTPYGAKNIYGIVARKNDPDATSCYPGFPIRRQTFDALINDPSEFMQFKIKEHKYACKLYDENTILYNELTISIKNPSLRSI